MITLTDAAQEKFGEVLKKEGGGAAVRLYIAGIG